MTSRLRLDFHHIKVDFKKSEVIQPLVHADILLLFGWEQFPVPLAYFI